MEDDMKPWKNVNMSCMNCGGHTWSVYGLGFLGALIYFFQHSPSFGELVLGFFKAVFWPGVLVYHALGLLKI